MVVQFNGVVKFCIFKELVHIEWNTYQNIVYTFYQIIENLT